MLLEVVLFSFVLFRVLGGVLVCFSLHYSVSQIIGLLKHEAIFSEDFYFWFIDRC